MAWGKHAAAAVAYTSAAERLPWEPSLWEKAGQAYLNAKDYAHAANAYENCAQPTGTFPNRLHGLGDSVFALGNAGVALDLWNEQIKGVNPALLWPTHRTRRPGSGALFQ